MPFLWGLDTAYATFSYILEVPCSKVDKVSGGVAAKDQIAIQGSCDIKETKKRKSEIAEPSSVTN